MNKIKLKFKKIKNSKKFNKIKNSSWKTTASGITILIATIGPMITKLLSHTRGSDINWEVSGTAIAVGIGFILAKDHNK